MPPTSSLRAFIHSMPKAELHLHLEGTLEPSLLRTLHTRNSLPLPSTLSTTTSDTTGYAFHDLTSFLSVYYPAMSCLLYAQDFHDLAYAYLRKCKEQNVIYAEMFFDPQAHTSRGISFETVVSGYLSAIDAAKSEFGVTAQLIMCFLRDMSASSAMETLDSLLSSRYKDRIVGIGLDSDERGNPPLKFAAVFAKARTHGYKITCHCDIDQEASLEHIRQCVEDIHVDRIDHGTNVVESPALVTVLRDKGIGLTCCPISNSIVTSDFKGREMVELLRAGVKVTVNSDDPAYFRGYMEENLEMLAMGTGVDGLGAGWSGLERKQLLQLTKNAFSIAWIDDPTRTQYLEQLEKFEREWASPPPTS